MYSQRDEEKVILGYFGNFAGRFLEVGAYDGLTASNTLALVERGWSGVMVEPAPVYFMKLLDRHAANPRLALVNAALGAADEFRPFHYTERGGISTFDDACRDAWKDACGDYRDYLVPVVAAARFFAAFPGPYDFVSVDAEGLDLEIVRALPLAGVRLACVETGRDEPAIAALLAAAGLRKIHQTAENGLFARD
jgi:FkbM family methyltransferase